MRSVAWPPTGISATLARFAASTTITLPEASQAAHTSRPSGRNARLTGFLYGTSSSSRIAFAPFEAAMPNWASRSAVAERASAVRLPTADVADSGRVGCATFAIAAAKEKGAPCALAWQPRQVFSVTGRRPARAAPALSRITASGMYSLPAPWHDSHPTPSIGS